MPEISIFIPAYNAEKFLPDVLARISKDAWKMIRSVWIINDGSLDNTQSVISILNQKYPQIKCIHFDKNLGYGAAVKAGLKAIQAEHTDYAICLHADGQYAPELIPSFVESVESGNCDILQGSRIVSGKALEGGMPLYKYVSNRMLTLLENNIIGEKLSEYHTGYRAFSREVLLDLPILENSDDFLFDNQMLLQAFYSIRSERQLMERLEFDLLFKWFVGLGIDDGHVQPRIIGPITGRPDDGADRDVPGRHGSDTQR